MVKFIPYEKLSKKQQKEQNARRRTLWTVSPVTRKPANPKAYNRKKTQNWKRDRFDSVSSFSASALAFPLAGPSSAWLPSPYWAPWRELS